MSKSQDADGPRDLYGPVPFRFKNALVRGNVDADEFLIGCYLACCSYEVRNTNGGVVLFRIAAFADEIGWEKSRESLRQKVKALAAKKWITVTVSQGQRAPWEIALSGLAVNATSEATSKGTSKPDPPSGLEVGGERLEVEEHALPRNQDEPARFSDDAVGSDEPLNEANETNETKLDTACIKGAVDSDAVARPQHAGDNDGLLEMLRPSPRSSGEDVTAAIERAKAAQARAGGGGEIDWGGPPRVGADGLLADCEAMVRAGKARWIE